jgi:hypothetical protein
MKASLGHENKAQSIFILCILWRRAVSFTIRQLYSTESFLCAHWIGECTNTNISMRLLGIRFVTRHSMHQLENMRHYMRLKSRDSSVGIALSYGLDDRGSRFRFPAGAGNFSLHHRVHTGSGAHPASYPMGTRGSFPGIKAPGA